jgi:integrase
VAKVVEAVTESPEWRKLRPSTVRGYQALFERVIIPRFGQRKIASITSQEIETWTAELLDSGLTPASVRHRHIAMSKLMKYALKHRLISVNPCAVVKAPAPEKREHGIALRPEQVEAIATALDSHHPYGLLVRFTAQTGLRAAEIAGLRIRDVNLLKREIRVEHTLQRMNGEWISGRPKSVKSIRAVPLLSSALVRDLTAYLEEHPNRANPDALLWPGREIGGSHDLDYAKPFHPGSFYGWHFRAALVRAGLLGQVVSRGDGYRVGCCEREFVSEEEAVRHVTRHVKGGPRFHDLRHTAGSSWLAMGMDLFKVSRRLGHSTIAITADIYGHLMSDDYSEESARFDAWLAQAATK